MLALFKEHEGSDLGEIAVNNREGGRKMVERTPRQGPDYMGFCEPQKGIWILSQV